MGQTKHKPLAMRDFLRFFARNCVLHLERIFFQNNYKEQNITFFIKYSSTKVSKSHKQNVDSF